MIVFFAGAFALAAAFGAAFFEATAFLAGAFFAAGFLAAPDGFGVFFVTFFRERDRSTCERVDTFFRMWNHAKRPTMGTETIEKILNTTGDGRLHAYLRIIGDQNVNFPKK